MEPGVENTGSPMRQPFEERFGIRAQTTRSQGRRKRWARQWQDYMEECRMGARIGRGRQYAMSGNVKSLRISPGVVEAVVRGMAPEPYNCRILCETVQGEEREALVAGLRMRPMLLALLLAGELPEQVETHFRAAGVPLVPSRLAPLKAECDCPDSAEFCKHSAAVMFLMCEAFEQDPLLLVRYRGISLDDIFGADAPGGADTRLEVPESPGADARAAEDAGVPAGTAAGAVPALEYAAEGGAPLVDELGPLPFWRGDSRFCDTIRDCLSRARAGLVRSGAAKCAGQFRKGS